MNARDRDVSTEAPTPLDAEGPLRRWARRRREVAREMQANAEARPRDMPEQAPDVRQSAGDSPGPTAVEERTLTDEDMPSLDMLDEDSDYSGFLSPGVSEALRRRALRKLFSSAVFNVPDGLDDYDDDFTSFAALGDIVTSDMKHKAEVEAERARQARSDTEPAPEIEDGSSPVEDDRLAHEDEEAPGRAGGKPSGETGPGELLAPTQSAPPQVVAEEATPGAMEANPAAGTESEELATPTEPVALQAVVADEASSLPDDKPAVGTGPGELPAQSVSSRAAACEDGEAPADAGHPSGRRT